MHKKLLSSTLLILTALSLNAQQPPSQQQQSRPPYTAPNRYIDYNAFLTNAVLVNQLRRGHRVSEQDFIEMSREPDTIVLDARSDSKYDLLHIKGARHLSLPDFTASELAKVIPTKDTRVLIYCNNNFENEPLAFATKAIPASLNLYTFNSLYTYGYTNVYELGPLIDITKSQLIFEGTKASH